MSLRDLQSKIQQQQAVIGVIGLGYVGLPVAATFARTGFKVIGVDIKANRVDKINAGQSPIEGDEPGLAELLAEITANGQFQATTDYSKLAQADVVLIAVDTPVDQNHRPNYLALKSACTSLGAVMKPGTLVIIESTVAPGTLNNDVCPILEKESGLKVDSDFYLGVCPERVMPGMLLSNLHKMSRVCGGNTPETARAMASLYRHIVEADLDAADIVTAELVKTAENAYRDVQIAFANEVAMICEANGANVWRVRELVNKSPSRQMHLPGAGVGGHCIPKDPWLLAYAAGDKTSLKLIPAARAVNDSMPEHTANLVVQALEQAGHIVTQARVAVLGYAYLENSDDTRNSPSAALVARLHQSVNDVRIHDPWVAQYQGDVYQKLKNCDAIVLMVKHNDYLNLDLALTKEIMRSPLLIDGRGFFEAEEVQQAGLTYWAVGRGLVE